MGAKIRIKAPERLTDEPSLQPKSSQGFGVLDEGLYVLSKAIRTSIPFYTLILLALCFVKQWLKYISVYV